MKKLGNILLMVMAALCSAASPDVPAGALFYTLTNLTWAQGSQNLGGIVGVIYYAPIEDVETFPDLSAAGSGITDASDDFVMKTGKKFYTIYHTAETGKADSNTVGERDGKGIENMLEFFFPGSKQAVAEFTRFALNTPCVVVYKNTSGQHEVLGVVNLDGTNVTLTGDIPAYLESANRTTGAARADRRGTTFQFKQPGSPHNPIIYVGDIPLVAAS